MNKKKVIIDLYYACEENDQEIGIKKNANYHQEENTNPFNSEGFGSFVRIKKTPLKESLPTTNKIFDDYIKDDKNNKFDYRMFHLEPPGIYYDPAGVCFHGLFQNEESTFEWMNSYEKAFRPFNMKNIEKRKVKNKLAWIVYSYPIIVIECRDCQVRDNLIKKMQESGNYALEEYWYKNTKLYLERNLIVFCDMAEKNVNTEDVIKNDIKDIALVITYMKHLCGKAKWKFVKASVESTAKFETKIEHSLDRVRRDFEIFDAILSDVLFFTRTKQNLFINIYKKSGLDNDIKTVTATKNAISHENEKQVNRKTEAINSVVRLTGIVGLLFSIFGFCEIYGGDFISFNPGLSPVSYLLLSIGISIWLFFFTNVFLDIDKSTKLHLENISRVLLIITSILLAAFFMYLGGGIK